jgi:peptidoglycan/xylan/chitin deacetylase (PgdA/CDA1 family)
MKRLLRDVVEWLVYGTGVASLYRRYQRRRGPLVRVVAFHDVPNGEWFQSAVRTLSQSGRILTPAEFAAGDFSEQELNLLITFDDGYASWVEVALPTLRDFGIRAVFFVNSGLIEAAADGGRQQRFVAERLRLSPKRTLDWSGVQALAAAGHTIGGHTVNHCRLAEQPEAVVGAEVIADKTAIESVLGTPIDFFAYPFGTRQDHSTSTETVIRTAGYRWIFEAETGYYTPGHSPIPRLLFEREQSPRAIARWLGGSYDVCVELKRILQGYTSYVRN